MDAKDESTSAGRRVNKFRKADLPEPLWMVTRIHFQVILSLTPAPPTRFGWLRKWMALKLWPELEKPQEIDGTMQYIPVRGTD